MDGGGVGWYSGLLPFDENRATHVSVAYNNFVSIISTLYRFYGIRYVLKYIAIIFSVA